MEFDELLLITQWCEGGRDGEVHECDYSLDSWLMARRICIYIYIYIYIYISLMVWIAIFLRLQDDAA